jgi:tripartite-type tricarboxylate transporter receptor subunit TctC
MTIKIAIVAVAPLLGVSALQRPASALNFPTRPVAVVVPFGLAAAIDIIALANQDQKALRNV